MSEMANPVLNFFQDQLRMPRQLSDALFESAGKFERLTNEALKQGFDEECKFLESLYAARDAEGVTAAQRSYFPSVQAQMMGFCQDLAKISTSTNAALTRVAQGYAGKLGSGAGEPIAFPWPATAAPDLNGGAVFDAWNAMLRQMTTLAGGYMDTARQAQEAMAAPAAKVEPAKERRK
jgi:hypothetical protein